MLKGDEDSLDDLNQSRSTKIQNKSMVAELPWEQEMEKYSIALNGKALAFMQANKDTYSKMLREVILKASVYARMSPEDKALLVDLLQDTMKT